MPALLRHLATAMLSPFHSLVHNARGEGSNIVIEQVQIPTNARIASSNNVNLSCQMDVRISLANYP
jgi:hypothetical protein